MKLGQAGLNLIKQFEACRLKAYKAVKTEKYYTIGYGHYGADVKRDSYITQADAEALLLQDCQKAVATVNAWYNRYKFNQNQFDALVSFTYNCGAGNFRSLIGLGTRSLSTISKKIQAYNKAGGKVLTGLTRRRTAEKLLFERAVTAEPPSENVIDGYDYSLVFNWLFYSNRYPDLERAGIVTADALLKHFINFGMAAGRQAISTFNPAVYKKNFGDLRSLYGDDMKAYYIHYMVHGYKEGRKAVQ